MKYHVIAIEREYASGGSEIGEKLGERLGIPCYGGEVLKRAAARLGLSVSELKDLEENMTGSFLYGIHMLSSLGYGDGLTRAQQLNIAEVEVVRELATAPCVIVGRSSPAVLKEEKNALKVFIHADWDTRIRRGKEVYHHDSGQVEGILRKYDRRRANYFKAGGGKDWKDAKNYHMMLDSGRLGIDAVVDILAGVAKGAVGI